MIRAWVTNRGVAPAGPFWVDFYINPDPIPTASGILWQDTCTMDPCYGIAWQVIGLAPGESVELTSEMWNYDGGETNWTGYLPAGATDLYLRVNTYDADGRGSPFGVVHEANGDNNLFSRTGYTVTGVMP
jgi:hypothetical protein